LVEENSYNSYPLFRFYQHYADYFKSLPLEKSTAYTEDPLAMVGKKLQDKYGATRDTQKMIGGFWRDFWVKNLTHGYTNQVFNEPKNYNFWNYPSSADQTVYITPNGSKLVQDGRLVDSTKSGSYDLIRIEKNKLSGPKILKFESSPTFLFSNVTVLDEPTKNANAKLLETRVVDGNRDVATLYPDTQGSYLVLITNGDYGVSSVNLTLKLESPRLVVNPFKDANGNGKLDVGYDYTLKKIAPTTSAISYNVKGPSYPSGANFNTGDRGYLLFGTLTAGDYFITENKPPSGWTLRTARTV
jgi:hypothetical protein